MAKKKIIRTDLYCDTCSFKHWIEKEHLLSQVDGKPIILECEKTGERIIRTTKVCDKHPNYYA